MDKPKNYKFNIYVNQYAIIEYGLNIDFIEAAIFGMLQKFSHQKKCNKMMDAGLVWYKFQWKIIPQQLPTLGIKGRTACYNRMKSLCEAGMLVAHEDNKQNRVSWYTFGDKADLYNTVHNGEHIVHKDEQKKPKKDKRDVHDGEHTIHESEQSVHEGEQGTVHDGEHDNYTNNNYTNNNIDIPPKVGKIETKIPESWDIEVKRTVIQFLEYRQSLPAAGKIKTQQGWNGKINLFQKILNQHGPTILIKAINLSIEKEYKNVDPEWLFNQYPELRTNNLVKSSVEGISQPEAKKVLKQLWSNHKNLWKEKYTNKAKTNFVEALRMFYFDNPTLKPSTNGTTTP